MDADLQISTLGGLSMRLHGSPVTGFHSRKVDALVVYLCSTRQPQTREVLADLLWDEQRQNAGNLRVLLTDLRQVLAPFFLITRTTVAVNPDSPIWLDTTVFETGLDALKRRDLKLTSRVAADLENALALYRGDFLQGFYIRESPRFEEWVLIEQERLRRLAVIALQHLTAFYLERGEYPRGIAHAERLFEIDPLNELNHLQMMQLLARNGEAHAALARYEKYRQLLATELNTEPSAETTTLRDQIRAGTFSQKITLSARSNLPRALTRFVGREPELAALDTLLRDPEVPLITLVGPGGVGKTRLALRAAEQAAAHFQDGVVLVTLAAVSDPELVTATIAAALEVTENAGETLLSRVKNYLRDKTLLLLADNFEQVVDAAPQLSDLLSVCPRLKVLATSRERLHIYGEQEFAVTPLPFPDLARVSPSAADLVTTIARYPAVALFVQRAATASPDFKLSSGNARAVAEICARLDGLPLAIELAAAHIKHLSAQNLLERLARRLDVLTGGERDRAPRHQTLRGALDWSYSLLDERQKKMFRSLAVLIGGWTLDSAGFISGQDTPVTLNLLSSLAEKSLVQRVVGDMDDSRYTMLEIIREYALERLTERQELAALEERHTQYFLAFAREAATFLEGPLQVQWLARIEHELDNVRAVLHRVLANERPEPGIELVYSLGRFWTVHDQWIEGLGWLERLLVLPEENVPPLTRARGVYSAGLLAFWMSDFKAARNYLERALSLAERVEDSLLVAQIITAASGVHQSLGDFEAAHAMAEQGLQLMQEIGSALDVAWAQFTKSGLLLQQGDFAGARPGLELALSIFRERGDHWACAVVCAYLAMACRLTGDTANASLYKAETLSLLGQVGDRARIALAHFFLGAPSNEPAEHDAELAFFEEQMRQQAGGQDKRQRAEVLLGLAGARHRRGEETQAGILYAECLALAREVGSEYVTAECLEGFAGIAAVQHQPARAARLFGAIDRLEPLAHGAIARARRANFGADLAAARAQLEEGEFNRLWAEGRALSLEQAAAYALAAETE